MIKIKVGVIGSSYVYFSDENRQALPKYLGPYPLPTFPEPDSTSTLIGYDSLTGSGLSQKIRYYYILYILHLKQSYYTTTMFYYKEKYDNINILTA